MEPVSAAEQVCRMEVVFLQSLCCPWSRWKGREGGSKALRKWKITLSDLTALLCALNLALLVGFPLLSLPVWHGC